MGSPLQGQVVCQAPYRAFGAASLLAATLILLPSFSFAQASRVERMQQFNQTQTDTRLQTTAEGTDQLAPELYSGETSDTGPQFILRSKPVRKWIEATVDSQYFYTSNMLLTERDAIDTTLLVSTVQVGLAPTAFDVGGGKLSPRLGFRYQWYNYGMDKTSNQLNNFDFDVETVYTDAIYRFGDNWYAGGGFEWNRLLNHEGPTADYAEFYKEYMPNWSVGKLFPVGESSLVGVEYYGAYHFTEVDPLPAQNINDRIDHTFRVFYTHELIPNLYAQPFFRFMYTDYVSVQGSRNDTLYTVGCTLSYVVNNWMTVRTFATYDNKQSDDPLFPDYTNVNAGGGVTLSLQF